MGKEQTMIAGEIGIRRLGSRANRLTGKDVTVFTIDGNTTSGKVMGADNTLIYVKGTEEKVRIIMVSAIASISMSVEDAEQMMAPFRAQTIRDARLK